MKMSSYTVHLSLKLRTFVLVSIIGSYAFYAFAMERITTTPVSFRIELILPVGYRFNSMGPSSLSIGSPEATAEQLEIKNTAFDVVVSVPTKPQFSIAGQARVFFCEELPEPQCFMKQISFKKDFNQDAPRLLQIEIPNPKEAIQE
jgi:hypothetical protein